MSHAGAVSFATMAIEYGSSPEAQPAESRRSG
jgi:hypothetical protein